MGTTPLGITYPDPSSPVANLQAQVKQLAESADAVIGGSLGGGWQTPTLLNGWTDYGSGFQGARYRRVGTTLFLEGLLATPTAATVILSLPVGYRPLGGTIRFTAEANTQLGAFDVRSDGDVYAAIVPGGATYFTLSSCFSVGA